MQFRDLRPRLTSTGDGDFERGSTSVVRIRKDYGCHVTLSFGVVSPDRRDSDGAWIARIDEGNFQALFESMERDQLRRGVLENRESAA